MKKYFGKRVLAAVMTIVVASSAIPTIAMPQKAKADTTNMKTIALNTPYTDHLEYHEGVSDGAKYYKFTVEKTGYITFSLSKVDPTLELAHGWDLDIFDMDGNQMDYSAQAWDSIKTNCITPEYPFKKGDQYYVRISDAYWFSSYTIHDVEYTLTVNNVEAHDWEIEPNNDAATATELTIGSTIYGNRSCRALNDSVEDPIDYFSVTIPETAYYTINLKKKDPTAYVRDGWDVTLKDSLGNQLTSFNATTAASSDQLLMKKGQKYYISIQGEYYYTFMVTYQLSIDKTANLSVSKVKKINKYKRGIGKISWNNVNNATSYQIKVSSSKKFPKAKTTILTSTERQCYIRDNITKKRAYVKIRVCYTSIDNENIYSAWSKVKMVKR